MIKMRRFTQQTIIVAMAFLAIACNLVPDYVIQPDEMAELMADIRLADAVVKINDDDYVNYASKYALRKAVFDRHGITQQQFDTSLVWYGHNLGKYQDITKQSIDILEARMVKVNALVRGSAMSVAGDSVNIWDAPSSYAFTQRSPSKIISFSYDSDRNWESGDIYTWRVRFIVPPRSAEWVITTEYDDGTVETATNNLSSNDATSQKLSFFMDSTRVATHISGWMRFDVDVNKPSVVDSVGLIRCRKSTPVKPKYDMQRTIKTPPVDENV